MQNRAASAIPCLDVRREYDFPNGRIRIYADRTCREFPKWCANISALRTRAYVAAALRELRRRGMDKAQHRQRR